MNARITLAAMLALGMFVGCQAGGRGDIVRDLAFDDAEWSESKPVPLIEKDVSSGELVLVATTLSTAPSESQDDNVVRAFSVRKGRVELSVPQVDYETLTAWWRPFKSNEFTLIYCWEGMREIDDLADGFEVDMLGDRCVVGRIVSDDREPVRDCEVILNAGWAAGQDEFSRSTETDNFGRFYFGGLVPGLWVVTVAKEGYAPLQVVCYEQQVGDAKLLPEYVMSRERRVDWVRGEEGAAILDYQWQNAGYVNFTRFQRRIAAQELSGFIVAPCDAPLILRLIRDGDSKQKVVVPEESRIEF